MMVGYQMMMMGYNERAAAVLNQQHTSQHPEQSNCRWKEEREATQQMDGSLCVFVVGISKKQAQAEPFWIQSKGYQFTLKGLLRTVLERHRFLSLDFHTKISMVVTVAYPTISLLYYKKSKTFCELHLL